MQNCIIKGMTPFAKTLDVMLNSNREEGMPPQQVKQCIQELMKAEQLLAMTAYDLSNTWKAFVRGSGTEFSAAEGTAESSQNCRGKGKGRGKARQQPYPKG